MGLYNYSLDTILYQMSGYITQFVWEALTEESPHTNYNTTLFIINY